MRSIVVPVFTLLMAAGCGSSPSGTTAPFGGQTGTPNCPALAAAPTGVTLHVVPDNLLPTCADAPGPIAGLTASGSGYGLVLLTVGMDVHVENDAGFAKDVADPTAVDITGVALDVTGPIRVTSQAGPASIVYLDSPTTWRYASAQPGQPVSFTSP